MYSSLNYKDGLAITRRGKVIRKFPMVLGVDLAGKVLESNTGEFKAGDEVLVTGQGLGETIWGGYSQLARDRLKVGGHAAERNRGYHRRNTSSSWNLTNSSDSCRLSAGVVLRKNMMPADLS